MTQLQKMEFFYRFGFSQQSINQIECIELKIFYSVSTRFNNILFFYNHYLGLFFTKFEHTVHPLLHKIVEWQITVIYTFFPTFWHIAPLVLYTIFYSIYCTKKLGKCTLFYLAWCHSKKHILIICTANLFSSSIENTAFLPKGKVIMFLLRRMRKLLDTSLKATPLQK